MFYIFTFETFFTAEQGIEQVGYAAYHERVELITWCVVNGAGSPLSPCEIFPLVHINKSVNRTSHINAAALKYVYRNTELFFK